MTRKYEPFQLIKYINPKNLDYIFNDKYKYREEKQKSRIHSQGFV